MATARTKDGYLWIGTQEGVTRFDGVKFKVYKDAVVWANQDIFTNCMLASGDGSLWVGTRSGLNRISPQPDNPFTTYTTASGLPNKYVTALAEDAVGNLWIGTRGGLTRFSQGKFTTFTKADGLADDFVVTIQAASDGCLWIGTAKGTSCIKDGRFQPWGTIKELTAVQINKLYEDRAGVLWVGTEGRGLIRFKDGKPTALTSAQNLANDNVYAITEDNEGRLWIGTGGGLDYLAGGLEQGRLVNYGKVQPALDDYIYSIHPDREGSIWIGTKGNGLVRLRKSLFTVYGAVDGLSKDDIWCVLEARDGSLWIGLGAGGGLNRWKDGKVQAWNTTDGLIDAEVLSLLEARDGSLWIGTGGGLCHFQNGRFKCFDTQDGLPNDDITSLVEDADGGLWIGTYAGVSHFKDGKFDNSWNQQGLGDTMIGDLLLSKLDGSLWLASSPDGLFRLKDGKLKKYATDAGSPLSQAISVYEDAAGDLWVGTYQKGLTRIRRDGTINSYSTRQGLLENQVFDTLEDDAGNFWLTSNHGIFRVPKKQFDELDQGRIQQLAVLRYGISDGLRTNECNGGSQPSGWKTRDGRLLITTIKGLVSIGSGLTVRNLPVPPVVIERVVADKKSVSLGEPITVGPGLHDLEIEYTGLSLLMPGKIQFKYRLEGFDPDWINAGTRRTAYYTSLPHGDYHFRVIASSPDGRWPEGEREKAGAVVHINVKKLFYQSANFYLLCAAVFCLALYAVHRYRVSRLNEKLLGNIVQSLPIAVGVTDDDGLIRFVNAQFLRDFGYTTDEVQTIEQLLDAVYPDPEVRRKAGFYWQKALTETTLSVRRTLPREWQVRCKDGSDRDVDVRVARALDRIIVTLNDITDRKRAEETLKASHRQLRELAARLQQAREEERAFIAREIHDELGQLLTGLKFDIKWLDKRLPAGAEELKKKTTSILDLVDESIQAVRRIATDFRPGVLDTLGLTAAIEWQAEEFQKRTGIECRINEQMADPPADQQRATALFRIFQESLTNVARHSGATEVNVSLSRQNGSVILQVKDNGRGITETEISHSRSAGLLGMRERAHLFGGEVSFRGTPNAGTTVTATIPLDPSANSESA
ncbi:MAG TPA: two-component regulator propeller domain-containing protein [Blastocatellia bacterium]|nr:two-component regulator propeller domain-containing protein [Blastocatellia bacterium]HNG33838.1 two-component regulator propeller domain-containing protein [Blastocatellia bacterium]